MTREDKRAYNYARDRLANDDYPVYSDEYELELAYKAGASAAIQEACEWLYEYNREQTNKMFGIVNTADVTINVAEFRKAMKGE